MMQFLRRTLFSERRQAYTIPLLAIVFSLGVSALLLLIVGRSPAAAFRAILAGAGVLPKANYSPGRGIITDITSTLSALTPMIFASLSVTVAFKAGLFNIGVSGQMLAAGFTATVIVGYSSLPPILAIPLALLIGIASGAVVGAAIGALKHRFNINEVVSSIMLNYILQYVYGYLILTKYVDPLTRHSVRVNENARLVFQNISIGSQKAELPILILLAVAVTIALRFWLNRTRSGFELRAVGSNPKAARYFGVSPGRNIVLAMTVAGALAGLAGVTYYLGYYDNIAPKTLAETGFDAIAVSLLGNINPIGGLFASMLVTVISKGTTYMSSVQNIQREISQVMTGLILLFSACGAFLKHILSREE